MTITLNNLTFTLLFISTIHDYRRFIIRIITNDLYTDDSRNKFLLYCIVQWQNILIICCCYISDINECPHACGVNSECTNTPGSYTCRCKAGHVGDPYLSAGCHGLWYINFSILFINYFYFIIIILYAFNVLKNILYYILFNRHHNNYKC